MPQRTGSSSGAYLRAQAFMACSTARACFRSESLFVYWWSRARASSRVFTLETISDAGGGVHVVRFRDLQPAELRRPEIAALERRRGDDVVRLALDGEVLAEPPRHPRPGQPAPPPARAVEQRNRRAAGAAFH